MGMSYLPIFFSDRELLHRLSYAQAGKVIAKLLDHAIDEPSDIALSNAGEIVYAKMKQDLDRSRESYDQKSRNISQAARKREQQKRTSAQQSTIVHDRGEEKEEEKDKDKYDDKEKDNAARSAALRAGARERRGGKRFLKNNSESTIRKEDLFVPFWEVEGLADPTESADGDSP